MLRSARLVMTVLLATFIVAVPTAAAQQSPVSDQYSTSDAPGATSAGAGGGGGAAQGNGSAAAPVQVRHLTASQAKGLPFTGGQISLVALIGLALLALGTVGIAATRRRASASASAA